MRLRTKTSSTNQMMRMLGSGIVMVKVRAGGFMESIKYFDFVDSDTRSRSNLRNPDVSTVWENQITTSPIHDGNLLDGTVRRSTNTVLKHQRSASAGGTRNKNEPRGVFRVREF
jgi:hypothetical protein